MLEEMFKPENLSPGFKRGFILSIAEKHILKVTRNPGILDHINSIKFTGATLVITVSNNVLAHELSLQRYQLKNSLNERIKSEFIKDIRVYAGGKK